MSPVARSTRLRLFGHGGRHSPPSPPAVPPSRPTGTARFPFLPAPRWSSRAARSKVRQQVEPGRPEQHRSPPHPARDHVSQLQQKGYKIVDSNQAATFRVRYFVGIKQNTEYVTTTTGVASPYYGPWGYGYGYGWGAG